MSYYRDIRAFLAVVKEGSFSAAALREGVTAPMIGRQIQNLEQRLGVRLLHRTTRLLSLTEQGQLFFRHCQELFTEMDLVEAEMFPDLTTVSGPFTVLAPPSFGRHHVASHARAFVEMHPGIQLSFNLSNDYVDPLSAEYDLYVRVGNVINPRFVTTKLLSNRRVVCATPDYLNRHGVPLTLEDLGQHNCLGVNLRSGAFREWQFQDGGRLVSVKVESALDCNDANALLYWMRSGLGLAWRSTWEVSAELSNGTLISVLDDYALPSFDITAVYLRNRPMKIARLFIDMLLRKYQQPGYWP